MSDRPLTPSAALTRRAALLGLAGVGGLGLTGCDAVTRAPATFSALSLGERLTYASQRLILRTHWPLARQFRPEDMSPVFKANGSTNPSDPAYRAHLAEGFSNWRLVIDGLVDRPQSLSLEDLRALPARTQITRHDCVEGWSAIGQWTGPQLGGLLDRAGLQDRARFIVFWCADSIGQGPDAQYYESIDLVDAFHPQTILAHTMNGNTLPVPHGAPIRLRVERQLGYKQAKYIMRIEAVESFDDIRRGRGGFWPDRGYEWYAGI